MADNTINVRIKDRSDTEANWTSKNPVLLKGERAITDGTGKYKIGDGKNAWSALPYYEAMTSADRTKLNGIASGANKTTVDSSLSSSSTNPVQNKVVNSALANHTHDLSTMINTLSIGNSIPTDEDYFVSQYVGGGTTTTTYHRRPVKALLEYIKGKLAKIATSGSYNDLSNKPTIGNGTVTITQGGTSKGTFTLNQTGNTTIALTDNNSWRGIQNNLTSTSTTDSLSAAQGKILNERTYQMRDTVIGNTTDFNTITSVGCYKVQISAWGAAATYHSPNSYYASLYSYGLLTVDRAFNDGENRLIQIYYPHHSGNAASGTILTRMYNGSGWNAWDSITKGALDWSRILNKPSTFTPSSHNHDDRYYTESEMNSKLDAKSNTNHTHNYVKDAGNNSSNTTFAYSKTGMNYGEYAWLAGWNGYELRAVNKTQFATAGHTHNYAGSSSAGGSANSAVKLDTTTSGSATQPVYFSGGKPVAGTYTLGNACSKTTRTLTSVGNSGWKDVSTDSNYVPDMSFIAYWNGAYSNSGDSNLAYCNKGAFGTAAVKNTDYFARASHTHTAINNGITICGRTQNSGDDEGLVINKCDNNYAGLILGSPNGVRSVFYLTSDNSALWRYNNGSSSFDITHPKKNGTVALTSDIPSKLPASDVYAWAKASTKPSYSWGEISGKPSTYTPSSHNHFACQSTEPSGQNNGDLWFKEE